MGRSKSVVLDLLVKVENPLLVRPAETTERRSMFLSNIDQLFMLTVETLHFFAAPANGMSFEEVVASVERGLSRLLTHYDFMAGRVTFDAKRGRFQIDCNGAGALFAVASTELTVADLPDITYPNPAFKQLVLQLPEREEVLKTVEDEPLCFLQVTRFKCGGFAIGLGTNHCVLDGLSVGNFMRNLASLAGAEDAGLAVVPFCDRTLLKARSPPQIEYEHMELLKADEITAALTKAERTRDINNNHNDDDIVFDIFRVSEETMDRIKAKALQNGNVKNCSRFEALTAYLWRTRTIALELEGGETSSVLFAVDIRPRMKPPLPQNYAGNAVFAAYANATVNEIQQQPLSFCVLKVQEGITRLTDSYLRSGIDWGEFHRGIPGIRKDGGKGTSMRVSSWRRLGFEEIEYPWGKPVYYCPVDYGRHDGVVLLPSKHPDGGTSVCMALHPRPMATFRNLFHSLCTSS